MTRPVRALFILLVIAAFTAASPPQDRSQNAQSSFKRVSMEKLSERPPLPISDEDFEEFVSSIWCTTQVHGGKEVWYTFWGFNNLSNTISLCNFEMPTFVRPDLTVLQLIWDKDADGNLMSGSWMSGYTFVRQKDRIDILAGGGINGDIMHIVKTGDGWAIVAEGPHEATMLLTRTGKK